MKGQMVYITAHAWGQRMFTGIFRAEIINEDGVGNRKLYQCQLPNGMGSCWYRGKNIHITKKEAMDRFKEMKKQKIGQLQRQIDRIEKIEFVVTEDK